MKRTISITLFIASTIVLASSKTITSFEEDATMVPANTANGIAFPIGYQNWQLISLSHREDNKTLRAILGNPKAIKAIQENQTNPWPDGVVLGKMVWKDSQAEHWKTATVPAKFIHAEFMFKDIQKWQQTGGWGWARWLGEQQVPFGIDKHSASASCVACHTPVKDNDWVYTKPAVMPKRIKQ